MNERIDELMISPMNMKMKMKMKEINVETKRKEERKYECVES